MKIRTINHEFISFFQISAQYYIPYGLKTGKPGGATKKGGGAMATTLTMPLLYNPLSAWSMWPISIVANSQCGILALNRKNHKSNNPLSA